VRSVDVTSEEATEAFSAADLGAPSPRPRQVIGVGLNYADHAKEAGRPIPEHPVVFTKFAAAAAGPDLDVRLPGATVDWREEKREQPQGNECEWMQRLRTRSAGFPRFCDPKMLL
jgi:2-keto-4-pentenoate hydratase/2-oxohepta-3-ene-1,7-dioic acid hydratase in catechol pathway